MSLETSKPTAPPATMPSSPPSSATTSPPLPPSSRIFIRNLPPSMTAADFRAHFSRNNAVPLTDARLFPRRRFGYVGFRNPREAVEAVKWFDKTFVRLSRIAVEVARPVGDEGLGMRRRFGYGKPKAHTIGNGEVNGNGTRGKRKRGHDEAGKPAENPKLKEFLDVMQPRRKGNLWADEGLTAVDDGKQEAEQYHFVRGETGNSDDEYQTVPKKAKKGAKGKPLEDSENDQAVDEPSATSDSAANQAGDGAPVSDADWLRSRMSNLPGLENEEAVEEEEEVSNDNAPRPCGSTDFESDQERLNKESEPDASPAQREPVQHEEHHLLENGENSEEDPNIEAIRRTGRLFLRNLPYSVTEDDIEAQFSTYESLEEVHLPLDFNSGKPKGFGYVLFSEPESAVAAYIDLDGSIFQGRLMQVLPAKAKNDSKIDEFVIAKLPLKKQRLLQRKAEASKSTFNWNSMYMNPDAVMSSVAERLGVSKSELLDPTSSDAAVRQAHAETHVIQETKAYFEGNGVDLKAFKNKARGDTAVLVKNFPYGTKPEELRKLFEEHGKVQRLLMPPAGTIAIAEFTQATQARAAFASLAYRKFKDSILFLEKAPKDLFSDTSKPSTVKRSMPLEVDQTAPKLSTTDLLAPTTAESPDAFDTSTLFIKNLAFATTTAGLTMTFNPLKGFLSARVKAKPNAKDPMHPLSMGFGFVEFASKADAQAALAAMDGFKLDGHALQLRASYRGVDAAEEARRQDDRKKAKARSTKVIVKNLPFEANKKDVRRLLGAYGTLRSVRVPKKFDRSTRGFAFAEFATAREAEVAVDALRDSHLLGRRLVLEFAVPEAGDAEEEIARMTERVGRQVDAVAVQKLTGQGRRKFVVGDRDGGEDRELE
ncbi:hypothetical protein BDY21DRAFT_356157 [Lineolata rhizophorae]|uniref:Multiple RNA-binding domain-containing protein 1 n=1 Tax=Lineolata rhizophorae TaxID=578093 RepID=A0A6A6NQE7_9PEZI|nr:hypothetical protein BDY21DRAFT_356157 [Lineolata rhizophorae]